MHAKRFYLNPEDIQPLALGYGACLATDRITVDGRPVGYMYRQDPENETDSGWRFLAGDESDEYMDDPENLGVYDVNTIANCDQSIIAFLEAPSGSAFIKGHDGTFVGEQESEGQV